MRTINSKTLFISDLDGTLLNSQVEISGRTAKIINFLIKKGLIFTVATARTSATAAKLTERLDINAPAILMNGVTAFDLKERREIFTERFPESCFEAFTEAVRENGSSGFLYTMKGGVLGTYYVNLDTPNAEAFVKERVERFGKSFKQVSDFSECLSEVPIYFSISDKGERLKSLYEKLSLIPKIRIEYYRDVYSPQFSYLEVCSEAASKYNSALRLKKLIGADRIIAFGDNLNDLPLFRAADMSFAVSNAKDEVKAAATAVISSNDSDGVAEFLLESFGKL